MMFEKAFGTAIVIVSYCMVSSYGSPIKCATTPLHEAVIFSTYPRNIQTDDLYAEDCEGLTPMHIAILYQNIDSMMFLAEAGFDVNKLNGEALPILHYSVTSGPLETTKELLEIGSIPNAVNALMETPLYLSLKNHDEAVSRLIVASGASLTLKDIQGNTLAHAFVERKDLRALKLLVALNGELDVENNNQETPLLLAVKNDSPSLVNFLLAHGASISKLPYLHIALAAKAYNSLRALLENGIPTMSETEDGLSVIELAVKNELTEAVDILGSFPRGLPYQIKDKDGNSVLHVSVKYDKLEIVKKLLSKHAGHNLDEEGEGGSTAMELAIKNDNTDIMEILASFGADFSRSNQDKGSLMKQAIMSESSKAIVWLINHGANPMERDKDGNTHLHFAAKLGNIQVIKSLLSRKEAIIIDEEGENNNTAMELAIKNDDTDVMDLLASFGANIHRQNLVNGSLLKQAVLGKSNKAIAWLLEHGVNIEDKDLNGNTVLHIAVRVGDIETIKALLSENGSSIVDTEGGEGKTAMELAVLQDRTDIMKVLSSYGTGKHIPSTTIGSLLKIAVMEKSNRAIVWLIDHGADLEEKDDDGNTVLHLAVKLGEFETVNALLTKNGSAFIDKQGEKSYTPLEQAIINDRIDIMEVLTSYGANVPHHSNFNGPLLKLAVMEKSNKAIVWLIDHGADPEEEDVEGNTILHVAVRLGDVETIKTLLLSKNILSIVDKEGKDGKTAMELAVIQNRIDIMEVLASYGADITRISNARGSLLKLAVNEKSNKAIDWLISHRADLEEKSDDWNTILNAAVRLGDIKTIEDLLSEDGAYRIDKEGDDGNTAMGLAVILDRTDIMQVLYSYGSRLHHSYSIKDSLLKKAIISNSKNAIVWLIDHGADTDEMDDEENTLLHFAAKSGKLDSVIALLSRKDNFDINLKGKDNVTPLFSAVYSNQSTIVKELLQHGADIEAFVGKCQILPWAALNNHTETILTLLSFPVDLDSKCRYENTALMFSSAKNNLEVVKKLIELGADVNVIGQLKRSALIWAIQNDYDNNDKYEIVKVLLDNGAKVNLADEYGHTALYYAKQFGRKRTIDLIESKGGINK